MSNLLATLLALTAAVSGVSALPQVHADLTTRATSTSSTDNFSLFAFGSGTDTAIGGYPVFNYEGLAYIADPRKVNYTADYVVFAKNSSDSTQWLANALTATTETAAWANSSFYVPSPDGPIGFYKEGASNATNQTIVTTGFHFYGNTALVSIDGVVDTLWYAVETTVDGLWSIGWNATGAGIEDAELIALRKVTAPNVDYPGPGRKF
ncbi:unnamed protein product [Discula destructiva]